MLADSENPVDGQLECPKCGYGEFVRMPATSFVAFAKDYVCRRCVTRFPAPTPLWAAIVFIAVGVSAALIGLLIGYLSLPDLNTLSVLVGGSIASVGIRIGWFGIKAMKSNDTDRPSTT